MQPRFEQPPLPDETSDSIPLGVIEETLQGDMVLPGVPPALLVPETQQPPAVMPEQVALAHEYLVTELDYVRHIVRSMCSRRYYVGGQEYEDITQEAVQRILKHPHYIERNELGRLVCKPLASIINTYILDAYTPHSRRIKTNHLTDFSEVWIENHIDDRYATPSNDNASLRDQLLDEAIAELSKSNQILVRLHYLHGASYKDMLELTDQMTIPAIKSRLHKARASLARSLAKRGITSYDEIVGD